jgi:hypothetical protein
MELVVARLVRVVPVPVALRGGTGNAWAQPQPAGTDHGLILEGGFVVEAPRWRALARRVRALGFDDLGAYLAARYAQDRGSLAELAAELATSTHTVAGAMDAFGVARASAPAARGRSRRAASDRRVAARVAALGFADVGAWLADRDACGWSIGRLAGELGVGRRVVTRVLAERRVARSG